MPRWAASIAYSIAEANTASGVVAAPDEEDRFCSDIFGAPVGRAEYRSVTPKEDRSLTQVNEDAACGVYSIRKPVFWEVSDYGYQRDHQHIESRRSSRCRELGPAPDRNGAQSSKSDFGVMRTGQPRLG